MASFRPRQIRECSGHPKPAFTPRPGQASVFRGFPPPRTPLLGGATAAAALCRTGVPTKSCVVQLMNPCSWDVRRDSPPIAT
jgi:hypothetical protein